MPKCWLFNSITFTVTGNGGTEFRIGFRESEEQEVAPFVAIATEGTYTFTPSDMLVPASWDVDNPRTAGSSNIVAVEFQVASQSTDTAFDFCISNVSIT